MVAALADNYTAENVGTELKRIARLETVTLGEAGGVEGASDHLRQTGRKLGLEARARARIAEHRERVAAARNRLSGVEGSVGFLHVTLSLEQIPLLDADHLFFLSDDEDRLGRLRAVWERVPAVAAGRMYQVDPLIWQTTAVLANERKVSDVVKALA